VISPAASGEGCAPLTTPSPGSRRTGSGSHRRY
jgi:hypothetical protein